MDESAKTDSEKLDKKEPKLNDYSSMYIRNFIKITDPESGEVILETGN